MALTEAQRKELERRRLEDEEVIETQEDAMKYIASVCKRDDIWSPRYDYHGGPKKYDV
jgi:hypothetical protein